MSLPKRSPQLLLAAAALVVCATAFRIWSLVITNLYMPHSLAWSHPLALPLAMLLATLTALPLIGLAYRLDSARSVVHVLLAVLLCLGSAMLYPVACDTHESFVDIPNRRCECSGLVLEWYPRGVFDYSDIEYCIGVERPPR